MTVGSLSLPEGLLKTIRMLVNLILLIVAWLLMKLVLTVAFIYTTIKLLIKGRFKELGQYYYNSALSLDISGAVVGQHVFNDWFIKPSGYRFDGKSGKTISYHLKINKEQGTWYKPGYWLGWVLNKIDPNHLEKSKA